MATEEKKEINSQSTLILVLVALIVMVAIVAFAWYSKDDSKTNNQESNTTTNQQEITQDQTANVDKLGAREVKLTPENFEDTIKNNKLVLVDIYSPTCPHCQSLAPILTEISDEYGDKLVVGKMTTAEQANIDFALNKYPTFAYVPALWLYKDGQEVWSATGSKEKDELKKIIDQQL